MPDDESPDSLETRYFSGRWEYQASGADPRPDVRVNGQEDLIELQQGDPVVLGFGLYPGEHTGESADLLLGLLTIPGGQLIPLFFSTLSLAEIPQVSLPSLTFPVGGYAWLMILDLNPNGIADAEYVDFVPFVVNPPASGAFLGQWRGYDELDFSILLTIRDDRSFEWVYNDDNDEWLISGTWRGKSPNEIKLESDAGDFGMRLHTPSSARLWAYYGGWAAEVTKIDP